MANTKKKTVKKYAFGSPVMGDSPVSNYFSGPNNAAQENMPEMMSQYNEIQDKNKAEIGDALQQMRGNVFNTLQKQRMQMAAANASPGGGRSGKEEKRKGGSIKNKK